MAPLDTVARLSPLGIGRETLAGIFHKNTCTSISNRGRLALPLYERSYREPRRRKAMPLAVRGFLFLGFADETKANHFAGGFLDDLVAGEQFDD